jgi:hypothetical protein
MFAEQKQNLLNNLQTNSSKLLFPQTLITSLKTSGLSRLSSIFNKYNSFIKECRMLQNDLIQLTSWGLVYNSHYLWNVSVLTIIKKIKIYKQGIIDYIINCNTKTIKNMLLSQNNIQLPNIILFLHIQKIKNEYIFVDNYNITDLTKGLTIEKIRNILPRCILPVDISNSKLKYENIHELDSSDILPPIN